MFTKREGGGSVNDSRAFLFSFLWSGELRFPLIRSDTKEREQRQKTAIQGRALICQALSKWENTCSKSFRKQCSFLRAGETVREIIPFYGGDVMTLRYSRSSINTCSEAERF
ncbi:hypothetical protein NPIL_683421 [Nephila pilipes]|uniref:Uncharacterized protein n=1 Tax=Nephila pilipes TaxID=299642 RepID=A0A8X6NFG3_NEPPI|nr:hypothetical protein NPIL_683421 [Nephila pilipes]